MTEPTKPTKPAHPLASVGGIAGAAGGWALSHYAGPTLWILGIATLLLLLLFTKTSFRPKFFVGAISTTGGHVVGFCAAGVLVNAWATAAPDIIVLMIGIVWLWLRPNLASTLFLGLVQLVSLTYNAIMLFSASAGSFEHKALTGHCAWRILALTCLIVGYLNMRRAQAASIAPPPVPGLR